MATQLWLDDKSSTDVRYWYGDRAFNQEGTANRTTGFLRTSRGVGASDRSFSTINGPVSPPDLAAFRFQTPPLAADVTISQSISYNLWAYEGAMTANVTAYIEIERIQPDGTVTIIGTKNHTTEFGTASAVVTGSITPTSTACKAGDSIGVSLMFTDGGGTMVFANAAHYVVSGSTASASGDSSVTFTDTLSFTTTAPAGTTLYATATASDLVTADDDRKFQVGGSAPAALGFATSTGSGGSTVLQATASGGGSPVSWFTSPLQAVTVAAGLATVSWQGKISAAGSAAFKVELFLTAADGSGATRVFQAYVAGDPNASAGNTLGTTSTAYTVSAGIESFVISANQHLKLVVSVLGQLDKDSPTGVGTQYRYGSVSALGNLAASSTVTLDAISIKLPTTLTEAAPSGTATSTLQDATATTKGYGSDLVYEFYGATSNKTAGTSFTGAIPTGDMLVGSQWLVHVVCDNAGTSGASPVVGITDTLGNTWTRQSTNTKTAGVANDGVTIEAFTTTAIATNSSGSNVLTVSFGSTSVTAKVMLFGRLFSTKGGSVVPHPTNVELSKTTGSSSAVQLTTSNTLTKKPDLLVGTTALEFGTGIAPVNNASTTFWGVHHGLTTSGLPADTNVSGWVGAYPVPADGSVTYWIDWSASGSSDYATTILDFVLSSAPTGALSELLDNVTSSASGTVSNPVSGTVTATLAAATSTSSGTETISGTSARTLADFTSTTTATETISGTSAATLQAFTSVASGAEVITGTSARTLANATSTASGTHLAPPITGTAAVTLQSFTSAASGAETISGTSATTLQAFTATTVGTEVITGTSARTLADFTGSASGQHVINVSGTAVVTLQGATSTTSGTETISGTSAQTLANAVSTTSGQVGGQPITGTATPSLQNATGAASGSETISGSSARTLANATSSTAAQEILTGTGAATLGATFGIANGMVANPVSGTGSTVLQNASPSLAFALEAMIGTLTRTLADFTASAAGTSVSPPVSGTANPTLQSATASTLGQETISGASTRTLANFTSAVTAVEAMTGSVVRTLQNAVGNAAGVTWVPVTGTVGKTLDPFVGSAVGLALTGTGGRVDAVLQNFTSSASGTQTIPPVTGSLTRTLGNATGAASGSEGISGSSGRTLANFTSSATAQEALAGVSARTLTNFTASAAGVVVNGIIGVGAAVLEPCTSLSFAVERMSGFVNYVSLQDFFSSTGGGSLTFGSAVTALQDAFMMAHGTLRFSGVVAVVLAPLTASGVARTGMTGVITTTLGNASCTATGFTIPNNVGAAHPTLQDFIGHAIGSSTAPGVCTTMGVYVASNGDQVLVQGEVFLWDGANWILTPGLMLWDGDTWVDALTTIG